MKKLSFIITCALLFVLSACESSKVYIAKEYVNTNVVINGIEDPINNVLWLRDKKVITVDVNEFTYKALLLFTEKGDSVPRIFEYICRDFNPYSYNGWLYECDGAPYYVADPSDPEWMDSDGEISSNTHESIVTMINEAIYGSSASNKAPQYAAAGKDSPAPGFRGVDETINDAFNNGGKVELIYAYLIEEVANK